MDKRDKKIRQLEDERNQLMAENQELKYIINDIQSVNDIMREDIEKECAAECGCIVIEGMILSILVDIFISKISLPMQPVPEIGSISVA